MRLFSIILVATALAACGPPDAVENASAAGEALPQLEQNEVSPTGGPPSGEAKAPAPDTSNAAIPTALQGNWGMTPGDCTSTRGDAKGLLIVGPDSLKFYESRAVPAANVSTGADSVSGIFNYTGEGQQWSRHTSLELQDGKLIRTERDPVGSFTYVRC